MSTESIAGILTSHTKLIDIEAGNMAVVEDHWMPELVIWGAVERFLSLRKRAKNHLKKEKCITK